MCCRVTGRYLHTVCFCHNSIRNCPWSAVSVNLFSHWIFSSLSSGYADFSSVFSVFFRAHWLTHMRQTQVNNQILFALPPSAQLSMLNSDSLRCFCPFLNFLARWIPAQTHWSVPRTQLLTLTEFRASHMRCAPGYRHNDITGLIIGKPNKYFPIRRPKINIVEDFGVPKTVKNCCRIVSMLSQW